MHRTHHAESRRRWRANRPGADRKCWRHEQRHGSERSVRTDEAATRTGRNVPTGTGSDASRPHADPPRSPAIWHRTTSNRSIATSPTAAAASPTDSNSAPAHPDPTSHAKRASPAIQLSQSSRKIHPAAECLRATISTGKHSHYHSTGSAAIAATSPTADSTGSTHAACSATHSSGPSTAFPPTPAQTAETQSSTTATPSSDQPQGVILPGRPTQQLLRIQHQHLQSVTDGPIDSGHAADESHFSPVPEAGRPERCSVVHNGRQKRSPVLLHR